MLIFSLSSVSKSECTWTRCRLTIPFMTSTKTSCREFRSPDLSRAHNRLYWTQKDVLTHLAETIDEPHIKNVKSFKDRPKSDVSIEGLGAQYAKSANPSKIEFDGLRSTGGHKIQDVKELMRVPVIVMSDITKSPPVLVVYAGESSAIALSIILTIVNPYVDGL